MSAFCATTSGIRRIERTDSHLRSCGVPACRTSGPDFRQLMVRTRNASGKCPVSTTLSSGFSRCTARRKSRIASTYRPSWWSADGASCTATTAASQPSAARSVHHCSRAGRNGSAPAGVSSSRCSTSISTRLAPPPARCSFPQRRDFSFPVGILIIAGEALADGLQVLHRLHGRRGIVRSVANQSASGEQAESGEKSLQAEMAGVHKPSFRDPWKRPKVSSPAPFRSDDQGTGWFQAVSSPFSPSPASASPPPGSPDPPRP